MSARAAVFIALIGLTAACAGEQGAEMDGRGEADLGVVRTDPFRLTGAFAGDSYLITPCSDGETDLRLERGPEVLDLIGIHEELVPGDFPVETIFVDLFGEAIQDGRDTSFEVIEVYRAGFEDWGCTWVPLESPLRFAASGTEPGWTLHVGADSTVTLSRVEGTREGDVTLLEGSRAAGWEVSGEIEGEAWTLELFEEPCRNAMSGGYSHLVASLTLGGETWTGCGFIGDAEESL